MPIDDLVGIWNFVQYIYMQQLSELENIIKTYEKITKQLRFQSLLMLVMVCS